ncbi:MAG: hypothetical protein Q4G10_03035 [Bacteroidia bacterium]|nr:hypothetical protein [Bacteroidia bacterium]
MSTKCLMLSLTALLVAAICYAQPGAFPPPQTHHHGSPQVTMPVNPGAQPLLIISGKEVPFEQMRTIKPDDIESMSILRDSTMTARYGEKGKNGVIIVRLKSDAERAGRAGGRHRNRFTGNVDELVVSGQHYSQRPDLPKNLVPYSSLTVEPSFQGGGEKAFVDWLRDRIVRPDNCTQHRSDARLFCNPGRW